MADLALLHRQPPLVVVTTLALLVSGLVLLLIGPTASHRRLSLALAGSVDAVTLHQAAFVVWIGVTALHVLGRLVPAVQLTLLSSRRVPGGSWRGLTLLLTLVAAVAAAVVIVGMARPWQFEPEQ